MLDPWALRLSRLKKALAALLFEGKHLRRAGCLHALTEAEARACRAYGLRNPIAVIPNGIDLPSPCAEGVAPWPQEAGRVLLFLGRIHPKKGLANLLSAWARLRQDRLPAAGDWTLAIAGWDQNGHEAELREQQRELDLGASVMFVGPLYGAAKAAALRDAAAFVLPSFSEGLPMAVLEAWAHKLPVIMTPACNLPQGFQAGAAVRVESNAGDLCRGLGEMIDMAQQERRQMGLRGQRLVADAFAWPRIAGQMKAVYTWLLGGGRIPDHVQIR
jgi:poly(glycerol-phosphate) alpha-glucosyltransferase